VIGDKDPEDAYDVDDPISVRLAVLARVYVSIAQDPDPERAERRRTNLRRLLLNIAEDVD
jgi:hypothetical protein